MARRKQYSEEQEKEIKLLQASNEMYNRTLEEAKIRGDKASIDRIMAAQEEVKKQTKMALNGENIDEVMKLGNDVPQIPNIVDVVPREIENVDEKRSSIYDTLNEYRSNEEAKMKSETTTTASIREVEDNTPKFGAETINPTDTTFNDVNPNAQYDVIALPSNGQCYKHKSSRIPVAYLTAYDENIITSPNLYRDGLVIDYLVKHKVMNKSINVDELVTGDVDAIVLFLRATSYGVDFPIIVNDPETGEPIETTVDLTSFKTKEFKLKGDENGHFSYTLPKSGVEVKFRYLTRKDENDLVLLTKIEGKGTITTDLKDTTRVLNTVLASDDVLSGTEKTEILNGIRKIDEWAEKIGKKYDSKYNHVITNRMEMQITAVNGNYDRKFIREFIYNMPASDSLALRRYISDNEPGINFEIEVERPKSLGGGSFKTFLEWDDNVFFNIAG